MSLPTEDSGGGRYARLLLRLLGPAYSAPDGTASAAWWLSLGDGLEALRAALQKATDEGFVGTAEDTLDAWEGIYGLPTDVSLTTAERQARLLAKVQARRGGTAQGIYRATYQLGGGVTLGVWEQTVYDVPQSGIYALDDAKHWGARRLVYQFAVQLKAAAYSTYASTVARIVEQMKPAYATYVLCTNDPGASPFLCDSPDHLTDRDVVGAGPGAWLTSSAGLVLTDSSGTVLVT